MELGVIRELEFCILLLAVAITLFAGIVKGAFGFAMPLIMVSLIGTIMEPKLALASIIIPIVFSNIYQSLRTGAFQAILVLRDYYRYIAVTCLFIFLAAQIVPFVSTKAFYFILGIPVIVLSLIQILGIEVKIKHANRKVYEWIVGSVSGLLGGLAGTWGPTTVLYLLAIDTPKNKQSIVQGVIYGMGALMLMAGHITSGILNSETVLLSIFLLLPAIIGMWIGFKIQDSLSQEHFQKITLVILLIAGIKLIRLGLAV